MDAQHAEAIGGQIVAAREAKGWTQAQLAKETGLTDSAIRKVERGLHVGPGTLRTVLDAVGIRPVSEVRAEAGYPRDVEVICDFLATYLMKVEPEERQRIAYDLTRMLMTREMGS